MVGTGAWLETAWFEAAPPAVSIGRVGWLASVASDARAIGVSGALEACEAGLAGDVPLGDAPVSEGEPTRRASEPRATTEPRTSVATVSLAASPRWASFAARASRTERAGGGGVPSAASLPGAWASHEASSSDESEKPAPTSDSRSCSRPRRILEDAVPLGHPES